MQFGAILRMASNYTQDRLTAAVERVLSGNPAARVAAEFQIPASTLRKWVSNAKKGIVRQRRGPKPLLPLDTEEAIQDWIIGRQIVCHPVGRADIMKKAIEISELVAGRAVTDGWYTRFRQRHPDLTDRSAQVLSRTRNTVDFDDARLLFSSLAKAIIESNASADQVFNMDETAFYKAPKSKRVVAVRRSKNVWMATPTTSFHMTTIACGSAAGFVVPPVFILPGKTVSLDILQGVEVPGAGVTGTPTGFLNMELFELWLSIFAAAVPPTVKRPLILVMDGCGSLYSSAIIEHATKLQVVLVCLPANATHLFQPLDVAVFASFKGKLRVLVNEFLDEGEAGSYSIDKATAVSIACMAWKGCKFATNVKSGFEVCGLFPLSLVNMQHRMDIYTRNGTPADIRLAAWLQAEPAIRREILTLPLPATKSKGRKRKTAPVSG
ncbi:hypothetical protein PF007_g15257 [Phytophthora fragariae]|uniref:HTH CENPB-type domain-containing protein n=3 Tax=Phytophthora fragariae TaxID=53985 RepID=A0A6A3RRG4_9STRA|nr:hypothetical protein PF003_g8766 [Phytophthora fragariae]KAE9101132.1 hypothetical protein PF007_g15257 [Phytophthora fragariae]